MKILVTYASAGTGHFKAAEAIYSYLRFQDEDIQLKLIDVLQKSNILFRNIYTHGYAFSVSNLRPLWALGFWITYIKLFQIIIKLLRFIINRLNTRNFATFLIKEQPDFIISTHFLPSEISSYLKRKQKINSKLVTVITDFGIHPFWLADGTDIYIVATDITKQQLILEGVREDRIKALGIPTEPKFLERYNKNALFEKFRLDKDKFTVLITTGSFGIGPIEEIVDLLYKDVQILVVCAHNRRLYKILKNKNYLNLKVFGYIDNIQELMAISDIIITKPGGLTISESLVMNLLPVFICAIPGQETQNLKILAHYGIGMYPSDTAAIRRIVIDYKEHPDKIRSIKENIAKIKRPNASREIWNAVCQGSIGSTC
jgi:processive 1,2-diacylglycerol beta-glucosyltransferase